MSSKVSIANRALAKLGDDRILLLTDDVKSARTLNQMFDEVRDAELRRHRWKFAIKRASLPALSEAPAWGYERQFPLPSDYLAMVQIGETYIRPGMGGTASSSIEGGVILTSAVAPLKVRYVARIENTGLFDPLFVEMLACRLAMEACETLTQSETKFSRCAQQYKDALIEATRADSIEKLPDELPAGSWLDSRESGVIGFDTYDYVAYPSGVSVS
jgi:hypothetical protein